MSLIPQNLLAGHGRSLASVGLDSPTPALQRTADGGIDYNHYLKRSSALRAASYAAARRATSGLDFFRAIAAGALPQPPIYDLLGFRLTGVEPGAARLEGETGEHLLNPFGTVHGGYAATVLDSACGVGLQSIL